VEMGGGSTQQRREVAALGVTLGGRKGASPGWATWTAQAGWLMGRLGRIQGQKILSEF
jgi:hypothetical protein